MRFISVGLFIILLANVALAQKPSVTTAPAESSTSSMSETEDLIARLHALQAENELLRAQISSLAQNVPASAPAPKNMVPEKPLAGMEGLMQGFPKDQMPSATEEKSGLRFSLLYKWVKEHTRGRSIVLRARFSDSDGLSGDTFVVRVGSGNVPQWLRPFEATVILPASEASKVLPLHTGDQVDIAGRIQNADVLHVAGLWVVFFELDGGSITATTKLQ